MHELRTASHLRAEQSFLEMHQERERLWLAVMQQQIYEADLVEVCTPLCVDFALNMDEVYPQGWASVLADLFNKQAPNFKKISKLACGATSTTVLLEGGEAWSYGWGDCGQLGHGNYNNSPVARKIMRYSNVDIGLQQSHVSNSVFVKTIASGDEHTAILSDAGVLYTFGANSWGQLGVPYNTQVKRNVSSHPR